jgi:ribonucleoside-triphosphate reductase
LATSEEDFMTRLDQLMEIARTSLETKRQVLEQFTDQGLYPYTKFYLRGVKERYGHYWHNHFSTIGLVGMNEACLNLLGCDIGTDQGVAFAGRVLDHMRDRLQEFQRLTGRLYNLEATPAEGTAYRLARLDHQRFSDIRTAATATSTVAKPVEPFYTNSTQLPVHYTDEIFRVLDLQDSLQSRYTGGTVQHVFLGEAVPNPESVKQFVRKVCSHYRLPYFTLSPTFSICPQHGYLRGEVPTCQECGSETEVYSRVVGYLRPVNQWNAGKQAEFAARSTYQISENGEQP